MTVFALFLMVAGYGAAGYLLTRRQPAALATILGSQVAALLVPFWQLLYAYRYEADWNAVFRVLDAPLPVPLLLAGWLAGVPLIAALVLVNAGWWQPSYLAGLAAFVVLSGWWLLIELVASSSGWWRYEVLTVPPGIPLRLALAMLWGLWSTALLAVLLTTRRYTATSTLLAVVPSAPLLALTVCGVLGAPLAAVLLLPSFGITLPNWAAALGTLGTLLLTIFGAHSIAQVFGNIGRR